MLGIALAIAILVIGVIVIIAINAEKDKNKSASSGNLKLDKTNSETTSKKENETTKNEETTTSNEETTTPKESIQETTTENPITPLSKNMYVTGSANVRDSYDANSAILGKLELNKEVQVTGKIGEWYQIVYYDRYAFIHESLLSDNQVETEKVTEKRKNSNSNNSNNSNSSNNSAVDNSSNNNSNNNIGDNNSINNNVDNDNENENYNPTESPEERAARVNPNYWKRGTNKFVYNSDGSGNVRETIIGVDNTNRDEILDFVLTLKEFQNAIKGYSYWGYGCMTNFDEGLNNIDYSYFDIRDWCFGIVDENQNIIAFFKFDKNFNLVNKSFTN